MRLAAAACALAVVVFLAIFGAVLAQKASTPAPAVAAAAPAPAPAPAKPAKPANVVTEVNPSGTVGAGAKPTPVAQAPPAVTGTVAPAAPVPSMMAPAPAPAAPRPVAAACANPNAIGLSRTVEIDTTGGPGFGFEHFKMHDFLQPMEVVLTFDDGPWPAYTPRVL